MKFAKFDRIPEIKSVMTPFPWHIHIEDSLSRATEVMAEHEIRHLPVTDGGELVGIVSERDIGLLLTPNLGPERQAGLTVGDACVRDAYVVDLSTRLDRVLLEMAERHIDSALVVKSGRLAGIFTATDACRCFGELLRAQFPDPGGNEAA